MREARELVNRLKAEGYTSPHLERLRNHLSPESAQEQLETEILMEMAGVLGRAGAKVDLALLQLELADRDLDAAAPADRPAALERWKAARLAALSARRDLQIQREAVGIRDNRGLAIDYPVPPPRG